MNAPQPAAGTERLSLVHGDPLDEEPGIGTLTIPGYLRGVVGKFGPKEALVMYDLDGRRISWSYDELLARAREVSRALIAGGVGKDARVGVLMTNRPEYLSALFGIAMAGAVTVSLSTFSTPAELDYLLQSGAVSILLYERSVLKKDFGAMIAELEPQARSAAPGAILSQRFPFLRRLVVLDPVTEGAQPEPDGSAVETWAAFLAQGEGIDPAIVEARSDAVQPSDVGAIFFSSGTTSLPKGIVHAQRALALQWWRWPRIYAIQPDKYPVRAWTGNGFFWSGNISMVVGNALSSGGTVVLQPLFQPDEALVLMEKERVTYPNGRPHQWARLQASPNWETADLSSLHYMTYSDILMSHPTVNTDWTLWQCYGTTETLTINTANIANCPEEEHRGSYGRPLPGNLLKIFDPHTGRIVPRGERGEMAIKGPTLMMGYIGKTLDECFDDEGFFRTGDGGYVDEDGFFFWEGRLTEIIKTGGANVSPIEIDLELSNMPGIKRAQTVGVPDAMLGEMVVSCVVLHEGVNEDPAAITAYLKERFASFKVPRAILFFGEDELQVTGSGKVKFQQLREIAAKRLAQTA